MLILILFFGLYLPDAVGQTPPPIQLNVTHLNGNQYKFEADLETLIPLAGSAYDPFYSFYMDFGDGHFKQGHLADFAVDFVQTHEYQTAPSFSPTLRVYNNYSKGERPPDGRVAPSTISVTPIAPLEQAPLMTGNQSSNVHPTFIPQNFNQHKKYLIEPEDDLVFAVSYKNTSEAHEDGYLVLMYNEEESEGNHFEPNEDFKREYFQEVFQGSAPPPNLPAVASNYNHLMVWEISNLEPNVEKQLFVDFSVLGNGQTQDTKLSVVFIPNSAPASAQVNDVTMTVTRSRDPNEIVGKLSKRIFKKDSYTYKVHFFNESNGAAENITVKSWDNLNNWKTDVAKISVKSIKIGREIFTDKAVIDKYCKLANTKDTVIFALTGVSLNGLGSPELAHSEDAFGYIEFEIFPKAAWQSTNSQSYIVFENQAPVFTNDKKVFPQNRTFFGLDAGLNTNVDLIIDGTFQTEGLHPFLRWRAGYRFSDRFSALGELQWQPVGLVETTDTLMSSYNLDIFHFNPQVEYKFTSWFKASAGLNIKLNSVNVISGMPEYETFSSHWILDAQFTPFNSRYVDWNIGGRFYAPIDLNAKRSNSSYLNIYTSLRFHLRK